LQYTYSIVIFEGNNYKCTCCFYGAGRNDFDMRNKRHWKEWALKIETFLGPEMATSEASAIWAQNTKGAYILRIFIKGTVGLSRFSVQIQLHTHPNIPPSSFYE
jgi:hypothetical protein